MRTMLTVSSCRAKQYYSGWALYIQWLHEYADAKPGDLLTARDMEWTRSSIPPG